MRVKSSQVLSVSYITAANYWKKYCDLEQSWFGNIIKVRSIRINFCRIKSQTSCLKSRPKCFYFSMKRNSLRSLYQRILLKKDSHRLMKSNKTFHRFVQARIFMKILSKFKGRGDRNLPDSRSVVFYWSPTGSRGLVANQNEDDSTNAW